MPRHSKPPEIDWASAEIQQGKLIVELSESPSKDWRRHFDGVLRLLQQGTETWGVVALSKSRVTVAEVEDGAEADLHHFLESVVLQVNSSLGSEHEDADVSPRAPQAIDQKMTAVFRQFAERSA